MSAAVVLRSPGALGSVPCCLCCQLFGEHSEKLWLVMIRLCSVQDVRVNVKNAEKFCASPGALISVLALLVCVLG